MGAGKFSLMMLLLVFYACSGGGKKSKHPSAPAANKADVEEPSDAGEGDEDDEDGQVAEASPERTLRSGTQYVAAVAKTLGLGLAELTEAYEKVKTNLPESAEASDKNIHEGLWISASSVASVGCTLYIDKLPNKGKDVKVQEALKQLADLIYLEQTEADAAVAQVQTYLEKLGNDPVVNTRTGCMLLVSTLAFF